MQSMWREDLKQGMTPFQFLLFCSRPYRWWAIGAFSLVTVTVTLQTSVSYAYKLIVNAAGALTTGGSATALWHAAFLYILIFSLELLLWRAPSLLSGPWQTGIRATGRYALSSYVLHHSNDYFSNRFAGAVASKITTAAENARSLAGKLLWEFMPLCVTLVVSILFVSQTSSVLTYILLIWTACVIPLNIFLSKRRAYLSMILHKTETVLGGATVDTLTNVPAVQDYANGIFELSRLKRLISDRRTKGLTNSRYGDFVLFINNLVQIVFIASLICITIYYASVGRISAGDIVLILSLVLIIQGRLSGIASTLSEFSESWGAVKESLEDILINQEIPDKKGARELSISASSITFVDTTFTYGETPVFENLSLTIPQGQKVGLVGRSGAGKSTLVKLLLRHYDLTGGSIKIGDQNIADVTKDSLRRAIAVVPQEPLLFHRSIRDNIAYGKPSASLEEVIKAAKLAEAHEFIEKVPAGYDALVGERGVKLSGGQRQRIVIARAILKDAPILLLDEATSALDSESEGAVQKALFTLMEHRTVIAIAHRLSTLRAMDRIIVMDEGKIIEDGTHEELLAKNGVYAMLWNHQAGGFIEE